MVFTIVLKIIMTPVREMNIGRLQTVKSSWEHMPVFGNLVSVCLAFSIVLILLPLSSSDSVLAVLVIVQSVTTSAHITSLTGI